MKARKDVKIARYELKKVEQNVLFKTVKAFTDVIPCWEKYYYNPR